MVLEGFLICVTSLAKGGYVFGSVSLSVCLFVCLLASNITQNAMTRLQWKFMERSGVVQERTDTIMVSIWVFLDE